MKHILFYYIGGGLWLFWLSDLKQSTEYSLKQPSDSEKRCFDRYVDKRSQVNLAFGQQYVPPPFS